ncbi:D-lyxose/D-mannose family sugar isomerase [Rariglobus hedericola]|uniref:D-lyxose ketol-isomerase n=1 Tax=Rariglobus hedericola TaxID=2597822 RepID=A0A556QSJ7_9BACT|nr:D-lyxose/D-mannose family sugar isomerase [Rariglobus hedericola]TSJ79614.1 D-lyxose/D-mannose family sugar isomerase [Rariglobus hedericola]
MKRSDINRAFRDAAACFAAHHWTLPPNAAWDITDFGLGDFARHGLTLINLAEEPEYCEKLMYARRGQTTPGHTHAKKKEDIICRSGELTLELWAVRPGPDAVQPASFTVPVNGLPHVLRSGEKLVLPAGSRVTLIPGIWHAFYPSSEECIIGEVSTANDDVNDNIFTNPDIGRFPGIEEDEPAALRLLSEK